MKRLLTRGGEPEQPAEEKKKKPALSGCVMMLYCGSIHSTAAVAVYAWCFLNACFVVCDKPRSTPSFSQSDKAPTVDLKKEKGENMVLVSHKVGLFDFPFCSNPTEQSVCARFRHRHECSKSFSVFSLQLNLLN